MPHAACSPPSRPLSFLPSCHVLVPRISTNFLAYTISLIGSASTDDGEAALNIRCVHSHGDNASRRIHCAGEFVCKCSESMKDPHLVQPARGKTKDSILENLTKKKVESRSDYLQKASIHACARDGSARVRDHHRHIPSEPDSESEGHVGDTRHAAAPPCDCSTKCLASNTVL